MTDSRHLHPRLVRVASADARDAAWPEFLDAHSRLILHTARRSADGEDDVMDRYTYVLDRLREDDFRRLRAFSLNGSGKFTTWLVVVVRRLCIDHHRRAVGRGVERQPQSAAEVARRNLAGLVADELDPDRLAEEAVDGADVELIHKERAELVSAALSELETTDQLLLTLRYIDEHSPAKVARMLGYSSRFVVRRRIKTLIELLRASLEEKGFER